MTADEAAVYYTSIVGGMSFGTVLTLFVVPTAYTLLARDRGRSREPAGPALQRPAGE